MRAADTAGLAALAASAAIFLHLWNYGRETMLDRIKRKAAGAAIGDLLKSLATNKDTQTSVTGLIAGVVLAIHGLNLEALVAGDPHQIALVVSGLATWGMGVVATRADCDGRATLLGVVAAAARAYVGDFAGAVALATCGYLTNKPVEGEAQASAR